MAQATPQVFKEHNVMTNILEEHAPLIHILSLSTAVPYK